MLQSREEGFPKESLHFLADIFSLSLDFFHPGEVIGQIEMDRQISDRIHDILIKLVAVLSLEPALLKVHEELDDAVPVGLTVVVVEENGIVDESNRAARLLRLARGLVRLRRVVRVVEELQTDC